MFLYCDKKYMITHKTVEKKRNQKIGSKNDENDIEDCTGS